MTRCAHIPTVPSRRGFLTVLSAGAATLAIPAAIGVPGVPETGLIASPPADDPDAKLRDLGRQLRAAVEEVQQLQEAAGQATSIAHEEIVRRLGFDPQAKAMTKTQQKLAWKTRCAVYEELGTNAVIERGEPADARMDAIHEEMMALPIKTLRGAAIMASAAILTGAISDYWTGPEKDLEWEQQVVRRLIDKIFEPFGLSMDEADNGRAQS
jgi:hypothetical protein